MMAMGRQKCQWSLISFSRCKIQNTYKIGTNKKAIIYQKQNRSKLTLENRE